jgi:hypothetical protein
MHGHTTHPPQDLVAWVAFFQLLVFDAKIPANSQKNQLTSSSPTVVSPTVANTLSAVSSSFLSDTRFISEQLRVKAVHHDALYPYRNQRGLCPAQGKRQEASEER